MLRPPAMQRWRPMLGPPAAQCGRPYAPRSATAPPHALPPPNLCSYIADRPNPTLPHSLYALPPPALCYPAAHPMPRPRASYAILHERLLRVPLTTTVSSAIPPCRSRPAPTMDHKRQRRPPTAFAFTVAAAVLTPLSTRRADPAHYHPPRLTNGLEHIPSTIPSQHPKPHATNTIRTTSGLRNSHTGNFPSSTPPSSPPGIATISSERNPSPPPKAHPCAHRDSRHKSHFRAAPPACSSRYHPAPIPLPSTRTPGSILTPTTDNTALKHCIHHLATTPRFTMHTAV
ncbi:hypothetical protein B0H14DRAFT_3526844 [Mycena olivaceomarginata]|nr:hypothetical protein B0H14DRAFT_3526844 [Mycena olivaceomarginata]